MEKAFMRKTKKRHFEQSLRKFPEDFFSSLTKKRHFEQFQSWTRESLERKQRRKGEGTLEKKQAVEGKETLTKRGEEEEYPRRKPSTGHSETP